MSKAKMPAKSRMARDKAVHLGVATYRNVVLPQVKRDHHGEYVAIDVDTTQLACALATRPAVAPDGVHERASMKCRISRSGECTRPSKQTRGEMQRIYTVSPTCPAMYAASFFRLECP